MIDPRITVIENRLSKVHRVIAVSSGKGGVGKSLVASVLALNLTRKGFKVGFFDLDFTSPSSHIILGLGDQSPKEEKGLIPPEVHGLRYMSIVYYSREQASPLRGVDISNALIELLAVTLWDSLDFLVIDMPPGISDATLDLLRLIKKIEFIVVTTPSKLAYETVRKLTTLLSDLNIPVIGIIENMKTEESLFIQKQAETKGLRFWGELLFDPQLEDTLGDTDRLLKTRFSEELLGIVEKQLKD